ncbi:MAG: EamA family transporter [Alphaproteobacteria bacterium]
MSKTTDIFLTASAPAIWGSTYFVTTEFLPDGYPLTVAMLRALPAGLLLLLIVRRLPTWDWLGRVTVLGALNFSVFWVCLFIAAYRLPGGVAATVGAVQPLIVIVLSRAFLGNNIRLMSILAAMLGLGGVALLILTPAASLDLIGVSAGIGGAASMAAGTVLSRKWQPNVPLLAFTAWQLTAGGLLLLPIALWVEPPLPPITGKHVAGFIYLGLIGAAMTYAVWFRGIARLEPSAASSLGFLSPLIAVALGWVLLDEHLTPFQFFGATIVLISVWLSQNAGRIPRPQAALVHGASQT